MQLIEDEAAPAPAWFAPTPPPPMQNIKIVTVNVRYDGRAREPVPIPSSGTIQYPRSWKELPWSERPWAERRSRLVDALAYLDPDVIGFQEVLCSQLHDLAALLGDGYAHVGVGRDDGKRAGEYSPIFYKTSTFQYVDHTYKWLSTTPDVPGSKDWDASQTRIATFLSLCLSGDAADAQSSRLVHVINTHYDDGGRRARSESSLIIRAEARKWIDRQDAQAAARSPSSLVILTGDFNSPPEEEGYKNVVLHAPLPSGGPSLTFSDAYGQLQSRGTKQDSGPHTRPSGPYGPSGTYTDFSRPGSEVDSRIDFVFLADGRTQIGHDTVEKTARPPVVSKLAVVDNLIAGKGDAAGWTGRWSDHRAVFVEVQLAV